MSETELPRDHFVSRGYQQNFASPDKRVAVISTASGRLIDVGRPIEIELPRARIHYLPAGGRAE
ncbi:MAG: hypothetical protein QM747_17720 [Nocardioides sp.]